MSAFNSSIIAMVLSLFIAALLPRASYSDPRSNAKDVVLRFVEAYNQHDVEQMLAHCTDDVRWLSVSGDTVSVEAAGKATLRSSMAAHFKNSPTTRSELLAVEADGPMVVAIEKAMSGPNETDRTQCSASVYQLHDGLVQNVWYFDAYRCGR